MLPLPVLIAGGLVLAWVFLSPASPTSPFRGQGGAAPPVTPPTPLPPYVEPPALPGASVDNAGPDGVPPFISGV